MTATASSAQIVSAGGRSRMGRVVANSGRDILVLIDAADVGRNAAHPGDVVVVGSSCDLVVGIVSALKEPAPGLESDGGDIWVAQVELLGTLGVGPARPVFTRSVATPPTLGDVVYSASHSDLARLLRNDEDEAYSIGRLTKDETVEATLDANRLLNGGFAVMGRARSGKSCTLAAIARAFLRHRHGATFVLVDPYNEYGRSFGKAAAVLAPEPGLFPHWLMSFAELRWALSQNGGPMGADESSVLEEAIPAARLRYRQRQHAGRQMDGAEDRAAATVESPFPYRLLDLISYIDKAASVEDYRDPAVFRRLRARIMASLADPRLAIFFGNGSVSDNLDELIGKIFRIGQPGPPMTVLQFAELSAGVDRVAMSVLARLTMVVAQWGSAAHPTVLLVEDAIRFAAATPNDDASQLSLGALRELGGTAQKLGISVGLVVSDTRQVSPEIIDACSTYFVHRLSRNSEIELVEDMLPEAAALLALAPNLGCGEVIGVGAGLSMSGRFKVSHLPEAAIPTERSGGLPPVETGGEVADIISRWRESRALRGLGSTEE